MNTGRAIVDIYMACKNTMFTLEENKTLNNDQINYITKQLRCAAAAAEALNRLSAGCPSPKIGDNENANPPPSATVS